jgi:hypothetical protein
MANEKRKQCRVTFTMRADLAAILMKPLRGEGQSNSATKFYGIKSVH